MMGKELEGLTYKELEHLEHQLHDGMLAVKNRKVLSFTSFLSCVSFYFQT